MPTMPPQPGAARPKPQPGPSDGQLAAGNTVALLLDAAAAAIVWFVHQTVASEHWARTITAAVLVVLATAAIVFAVRAVVFLVGFLTECDRRRADALRDLTTRR